MFRNQSKCWYLSRKCIFEMSQLRVANLSITAALIQHSVLSLSKSKFVFTLTSAYKYIEGIVQ